jgi:hypothetical protein
VSEFYTSKRIVAAALAMSVGLVSCSNSTEIKDDDVDHYISSISSPHDQNGSVPEGRVFPLNARVRFRDGSAEYYAPSEVAAKTGLLEVTAFCGNPSDKRDPQNLYAAMSVRREDGKVWEVMAGIAAAAACSDGIINEADRPAL